jgi:hypothetical protein
LPLSFASSSPHPQSYASPMSSQLNSGFFSLLLTMLCTKQPHIAAAERDETCGGYLTSTFQRGVSRTKGIVAGTSVRMIAGLLFRHLWASRGSDQMLCAAPSKRRALVRPCEKRAWSAKCPQLLLAITRRWTAVSALVKDVLGRRVLQFRCNRMACQRSATEFIPV